MQYPILILQKTNVYFLKPLLTFLEGPDVFIIILPVGTADKCLQSLQRILKIVLFDSSSTLKQRNIKLLFKNITL